MIQGSLFFGSQTRRGWKPPKLPSLRGLKELVFDYETNGLGWYKGDRPIGVGVGTLDGHQWYLPTDHSGGNLDREQVKAWMRSDDGLKGKRLITANGRFEVHMSREWGVDLEQLGCTVRDVMHSAAVLDDHRRKFALEELGQTYCHEGKVQGLDKTKMALYHAADVEAYVHQDLSLTGRVHQAMEPLLDAQGLNEVMALEDEVIFPTCEMERNGSPLDRAKLERWSTAIKQDYVKACWELFKESGLRIEPGKPADARKLFGKFSIPIPINTFPGPDQGKETFADAYLARIDHPAIKVFRRARKLGSLDSKFIKPYLRDLNAFGLLRYSLNQLRGEDEGTVSGRFSSSQLVKGLEGVNIQQVAGKKQLAGARLGDDSSLGQYIIRELFVPGSGLWFSSDAEQIEYRLFAHYAKPPRVLAAYARDPYTDFHNAVMEMILQTTKTAISRERTKDVNFAKIYGAGLRKIALMLGLPIDVVRPLIRAYDSAFPEAQKLLTEASDLAESRGYVKTILGRRARFPQKFGLHAALNRVIQGTAADINKRKLVELYKARKQTGLVMRFTVHDEVNGDVPDVEAARMCDRILNEQSYPTVVPILWKSKVGPNWARGEKIAA